MTVRSARIAVVTPYYIKALTIGQTAAGFRKALRAAWICVYDNNSKDRTVEQAAKAGRSFAARLFSAKGMSSGACFRLLTSHARTLETNSDQGVVRDLARAARRAIKPRLCSAVPARGTSIAAEHCREAGL
jgi:hypothetical protein